MSEPVRGNERALRPDHVAGYVVGVIATLVAIGGLYLANKLEATTAMAIVAAGSVAIWIGRASFRLVMLEARGHMGSCVPEGLAELRRSWPVVLAGLPPVLALAAAAAKAWSVTVGLHIGQALGVCGLIAAGLLTARRLQATGWAMASYVLWLTVSGLLVVGIELLARTV
ncbi:MAG: hypothetical protein ACTHQQ_11570 [Solirubrobacteraceae bacterium]